MTGVQTCALPIYGEHFAHTGTTARAFITDDEHVIGLDLAVLDGSEGILLAIKDAGGAAMFEALVACDLDDTAFGSDIALEDNEAAGRLDGSR